MTAGEKKRERGGWRYSGEREGKSGRLSSARRLKLRRGDGRTTRAPSKRLMHERIEAPRLLLLVWHHVSAAAPPWGHRLVERKEAAARWWCGRAQKINAERTLGFALLCSGLHTLCRGAADEGGRNGRHLCHPGDATHVMPMDG